MSRDSYKQSIFTLPNRIVTDGNETWAVPLAEVVGLVESSEVSFRSPSCLFQIAHCGSTLLSRALDMPGRSLVIRESFALRQFTATPLSPNSSQNNDRQRALKALWHLLGRQYDPSETVLLKGNVPVNYSLPEIFEVTPELAGICLYSKFDDYLVAALKSDERRMWVKHVAREMAPRIKLLGEFESIDFDSLEGGQSAAVLWRSQVRMFEDAIKSNTGLRALCSDQLYQNPRKVLRASAAHLNISLEESEIDDIVQSDLFKRHAKMPELEYSAEQRAIDEKELHSLYKTEVSATKRWCDKRALDTETHLGEKNFV